MQTTHRHIKYLIRAQFLNLILHPTKPIQILKNQKRKKGKAKTEREEQMSNTNDQQRQ